MPPPSASPTKDAPEDSGCFHQHPQVDMHSRVLGPWASPASPPGLTLGAHWLRGAAGVTDPMGIDCPHQEDVNGVGDEATHGVGLTSHLSCHRPPWATLLLATTDKGNRAGVALGHHISMHPKGMLVRYLKASTM